MVALLLFTVAYAVALLTFLSYESVDG